MIHDTTEVSFPGEVAREGLVFNGRRSTLHLHVSLLADLVPAPVVYGVVGARAYLVDGGVWNHVDREDALRPLVGGSDRWKDAVLAARKASPGGLPLVHVMDREADDFPLWACIVEAGDHFVVRSAQNRRVDPEGHLATALGNTPYLFKREVVLSRRTDRRAPSYRERHPTRATRDAILSVRAGAVPIRKPMNVWKKKLPASLPLNVVEVVEVEPPEGEDAVHWRLITDLPIETPEQVATIVDIYRKRWLIEEFFKSLKTGCALEERQAESRHSLLNTTALLIPHAVRLMQLRALARHAPTERSSLLDEVELLALRHLVQGAKLPAAPSNRAVLMAVAKVGGHLKSNGEPGWMVLGRGFAHLVQFAAGWRAAMSLRGPRTTEEGPGGTDM